MSAADTTRQAIVEATKKLISKSSFEKLSVIEITRLCKISRNTFYYHFDDKYAIIQWIFTTEIEPRIAPYMVKDHWEESISTLCRIMKEEKSFYSKILQDTGPGSLYRTLVEYYKQALMVCFAPLCDQLNIHGEDREIVARFFSHGTIDMICDWVYSGMERDADICTRILNIALTAGMFR